MSTRDKSDSKLAAQAARTRARLVEATLELLPQFGFHGLSLDAVAAHVGMTKGAIYGHFPSKDALILAAIGSRPEMRPDSLEWPKGRHGTVRERLRRLGEAVLATQAAAGRMAIVNAEFLLHALKDEKMREFIDQAGAQSRKRTEEHILNLFAPQELPMSVEAFALLITTILPSLNYARAFEDMRARDEIVLAMFEGLAGAAKD